MSLWENLPPVLCQQSCVFILQLLPYKLEQEQQRAKQKTILLCLDTHKGKQYAAQQHYKVGKKRRRVGVLLWAYQACTPTLTNCRLWFCSISCRSRVFMPVPQTSPNPRHEQTFVRSSGI